jgi:hypothetical protein
MLVLYWSGVDSAHCAKKRWGRTVKAGGRFAIRTTRSNEGHRELFEKRGVVRWTPSSSRTGHAEITEPAPVTAADWKLSKFEIGSVVRVHIESMVSRDVRG